MKQLQDLPRKLARGPYTQAFALSLAFCQLTLADNNWPQFRGPGATGVADGKPPTEWNVETGENIRWKVDVPGLGHSSPIVWEDRVFLTTAVSNETDTPTLETGWSGGSGESAADAGAWTWKTLCYDLKTGKQLWSQDAHTGVPLAKRHIKATYANSTPATDGKHVLAFFGSEGLYCYDMDGKLLWKTDFGVLKSGPYNMPELEWGFASSPVIHEDKVVVQCDVLNGPFVAILDIKDGKEIRRIEREEVATWSTPAIVKTTAQGDAPARTQIVCNGYKQIAGFDFETGKQLWTVPGGGDVPVPTPFVAHDLIFISNAHGDANPVYAVRTNAAGQQTTEIPGVSSGLAWYDARAGSYMPTPIVVGENIYVGDDRSILRASRAKTGEPLYKERLGSGSATMTASAVAADKQIYYTNEAGDIFVVEAGDEFKLLAENKMNDVCMATPAITGDALLIRTKQAL
ncbi:MAG: PQQ-binding-like beta-propeller repeat protein, partial [Phycisphaerae bacterium]